LPGVDALGKEEVFHVVTKVGAKRVVIVGWRTGLVVTRRPTHWEQRKCFMIRPRLGRGGG
jgi:hypothetical protein